MIQNCISDCSSNVHTFTNLLHILTHIVHRVIGSQSLAVNVMAWGPPSPALHCWVQRRGYKLSQVSGMTRWPQWAPAESQASKLVCGSRKGLLIAGLSVPGHSGHQLPGA